MSKRRPRQYVSRALVLALLLLLAPPLALVATLASETGTGWLLGQVDEMARPLGIELKVERSRGSLLGRLQLDTVVFEGLGTRVELGSLLLHWRPRALLERRLHIEALQLTDVHLAPPAPSESEPTVPEIPDLDLPVAIQLDRLVLERLEIDQPDGPVLVTRLALAASLDQHGLALRELTFDGLGAQLEGAFGMQSKAPHTLTGEISARIDPALVGDEVGEVVAEAVLAGAALAPVFDLNVSAPAELHLHAELQLQQASPGFDILAEWPRLQWPLQGAATITSRSGNLSLRGLPGDYRLELHTDLNAQGVPPGVVDLLANGDLQGIDLRPLKVAILDGLLQADGRLSWDQGIRWAFELLAERINPGLVEPELPGRVSGRIDVSGSLGAESGDALGLQVEIQEFTGELREYPVGAGGALDYHGGELHVRALQITSGPNRIYLDGRADQRLDLNFDIKAPELASLYPGLFGQFEGAGRLEGTLQAPVVAAKLNGQAVGYRALRAQEFGLDLDWRENGGKGRLRVTGLVGEGVQIAGLSADLDGTPQSHRLRLDANSDDFSLGLAAEGGLQEQVWGGQLQRLQLSARGLGEWRLRAPTTLSLGQRAARSGPLCLIQAATRACAEGAWDAEGGLDFSADLADLDLAQLTTYLPGEAVIEGRLGASVRATGDPARPRLEFELRPSDGLIRVEQDLQPIELAYRNARVVGRFENDAGSADLNFELGPQGRAQGRLLLGADKAGKRSIGGNLDVDFPDLALVAGFVPALDQVEGRLHLAARLDGSLAAPRVDGLMQISDAQARVLDAGIALTDIELSVRGDGKAPLRVQGQVHSGEGRITIDGEVDVAAPDGPLVDLTLRGENFQAVQLPEATVQISPDLQLRGKGAYHLSGTLLIPRAAIELSEVPSGTVNVSDDEIVVGEEAPESRTTASQNLSARVRIELGEQVTFKGFGLKTHLDGALDAAVDGQGSRVDGRIELRDGRYKAYGQDLTIERGRLLFVGPPGNPGVDLRAVRESHDRSVKAYLAMSGPLSRPRPRIYSVPSLPQEEVLAYLITGRGLASASSREGASINGAALSIGLAVANPQMQQMGGDLGLDEVSIEGGDNGAEDASVVLGKYLSPDLYVGYSQGLFNPEGAVLLRLRLGKQVEVESRSGNEQSVDLFYRIEHD